MPSVPLAFFFLALVILFGFVTSRLFILSRFPDIPILLSVGLLIGPLNRAALEHGFGSQFVAQNVDVAALQTFAPYVSSLALIVILFDSGLKLDFGHFGKSMRPAFAHTLPTFGLTVLGVALVATLIFGMPPLVSVVLGVALSNVGQTVSAAIIREIDLHPEVRSIYFVEMAIYDLISIPILVALLEFAQGGGGVGDAAVFAQSLVRVISISILLGILGGLLWIYVLLRLQNYPYSYMVTLAGLLLVYSVNSFLGGSGPVSVLIFGLVIGNRESVLKQLRTQAKTVIEGERVHSFHDEITFFVRSFYFVFLGVIFGTGLQADHAGEPWTVASPLAPLAPLDHTGLLFLVGVALLFAVIVGARYVVVRFISGRSSETRRSLFLVYGRGLGTAVLTTFPFTIAAYRPGEAYHALFSPWEVTFVNAALLIILLTVAGTSLAVWRQERRARPAAGDRREKVTAAKE